MKRLCHFNVWLIVDYRTHTLRSNISNQISYVYHRRLFPSIKFLHAEIKKRERGYGRKMSIILNNYERHKKSLSCLFYVWGRLVGRDIFPCLCLGDIGWSGNFFPVYVWGRFLGEISRQSYWKETSVGGHYFWGTWVDTIWSFHRLQFSVGEFLLNLFFLDLLLIIIWLLPLKF